MFQRYASLIVRHRQVSWLMPLGSRGFLVLPCVQALCNHRHVFGLIVWCCNASAAATVDVAAAAAHADKQQPLLLLNCPTNQGLSCLCNLSVQVELQNVRSFYKEAQKSPFKFFPWKTGNMHFKFLPASFAVA